MSEKKIFYPKNINKMYEEKDYSHIIENGASPHIFKREEEIPTQNEIQIETEKESLTSQHYEIESNENLDNVESEKNEVLNISQENKTSMGYQEIENKDIKINEDSIDELSLKSESNEVVNSQNKEDHKEIESSEYTIENKKSKKKIIIASLFVVCVAVVSSGYYMLNKKDARDEISASGDIISKQSLENNKNIKNDLLETPITQSSNNMLSHDYDILKGLESIHLPTNKATVESNDIENKIVVPNDNVLKDIPKQEDQNEPENSPKENTVTNEDKKATEDIKTNVPQEPSPLKPKEKQKVNTVKPSENKKPSKQVVKKKDKWELEADKQLDLLNEKLK